MKCVPCRTLRAFAKTSQRTTLSSVPEHCIQTCPSPNNGGPPPTFPSQRNSNTRSLAPIQYRRRKILLLYFFPMNMCNNHQKKKKKKKKPTILLPRKVGHGPAPHPDLAPLQPIHSRPVDRRPLPAACSTASPRRLAPTEPASAAQRATLDPRHPARNLPV